MLNNYFRKALYLVLIIGFSSTIAGVYEDFFQAVNRDDASTVESLLQRGFDPNSRDERGQTPLYLSQREGAFKVSQLLLSHPQIRVDLPNAVGETALMMAALRGHADAATRLLDKGARIEALNEGDQAGWTPLHYAASAPTDAAAAVLLARGAKVNSRSPNRSTPLMMAAQYGNEATVERLLKQGADARLQNDLNLTAADFARRVGRESLAVRLQALSGR